MPDLPEEVRAAIETFPQEFQVFLLRILDLPREERDFAIGVLHLAADALRGAREDHDMMTRLAEELRRLLEGDT
jgi:hypothetical protein